MKIKRIVEESRARLDKVTCADGRERALKARVKNAFLFRHPMPFYNKSCVNLLQKNSITEFLLLNTIKEYYKYFWTFVRAELSWIKQSKAL